MRGVRGGQDVECERWAGCWVWEVGGMKGVRGGWDEGCERWAG